MEGPGEPGEKGSLTRMGLGLGLLLLVLGVYVHQQEHRFATPVSRLNLLHSVVGEGTLAFTAASQPTPDAARGPDRRLYSDKAPGTAALALPGFWVAAQVVKGRGEALGSDTGWLVTSWAACGFSQALPAAVGGALLWIWLGGFVSGRAALVTVLGLWVGSLALPYSTWLYSHAQVIGLIAIAVWAMGLFEETGGRRQETGHGKQETGTNGRRLEVHIPRWRMGLAGFCLGLALASEYTAGLVVVGLAVYGVGWRRRGCWAFGLAAVPPLLLIPAYSWATIGTPFDLPYSYQASFPPMKEGLYAIKWPDAENLGRLLVGPTRGLVFWTPFLVMAGVGWVGLARERPGWLWLTYALPVLHVLVISGRTWDWQAGFTISARYMAPILPLLALPCALGVQRWPKVGGVLAAVSIGLMTLATVTSTSPGYHIDNPLTEWVWPKLRGGEFSPNLGALVLGGPGWLGVGLFYAILVGGVGWLWRWAGGRSGSALDI